MSLGVKWAGLDSTRKASGTSGSDLLNAFWLRRHLVYPGGMNNPELDPDYLPTLLRYYEAEIMGEAYFYALGTRYKGTPVHHKFDLLAEVERHAASAVVPLLEKYSLISRCAPTLKALGVESTKRHMTYSWPEFVAYMVKRYPLYMEEFHGLERIAPNVDQPYLIALTAHETAAIEFANLEAAGDERSIDALTAYLATKRPVAPQEDSQND